MVTKAVELTVAPPFLSTSVNATERRKTGWRGSSGEPKVTPLVMVVMVPSSTASLDSPPRRLARAS